MLWREKQWPPSGILADDVSFLLVCLNSLVRKSSIYEQILDGTRKNFVNNLVDSPAQK